MLAAHRAAALAHRRPPEAYHRAARRSWSRIWRASSSMPPDEIERAPRLPAVRVVRAGPGGDRSHRGAVSSSSPSTQTCSRTHRSRSMPVREYPNGTAAAHVLGYIGKINADELKARPNDGYASRRRDRQGRHRAQVRDRAARHAGRRQGARSTTRDRSPTCAPCASRCPVTTCSSASTSTRSRSPQESLQQGIDGASSTVSSDTGRLQHAEGWRGRRARCPHRPGGVDGVRADLRSQHVRRRWLRRLLPRPEHAAHRPSDQRPYAPGSTFKLFSSIAMLKYGIRPADETFYDNGVLRVRQRAGQALQREQGGVRLRRPPASAHGVERRVLLQRRATSSGTSTTATRAATTADVAPGGYGMQDTARLFGFDAATGVELPGDSARADPRPRVQQGAQQEELRRQRLHLAAG